MKSETKVTQVLKQAQAIVSHGWAKDAFARTKNGATVGVKSPKACHFCALGAIDRAGFELKLDHKAVAGAKKRLGKVLDLHDGYYDYEEAVAVFNDDRATRKEHVFDAFSLAIVGAP